MLLKKYLVNIRREIFEKIINFGENEETTIIRFDNLKAIFKDENRKIKEIHKFQLFILIDFVDKLLVYEGKLKQLDNLSYKEIKIIVTNILINNPDISGSSYKLKNEPELKIEKVYEKTSSPIPILSNFILNSKWELSLAFYRNLTMDSYEILPYQHEKASLKVRLEILENCIFKLYLSIKSCAFLENIDIERYVANIYEDFNLEFAYIQDSLNIGEKRKTIELIYREMLYDTIIEKGKNLNEDEDSNQIYRLINNFFYKKLENKIFDENKRISCLVDEKQYYFNDVDKERMKLICEINKKDLWNHSMTDNVKDYIRDIIYKKVMVIKKGVKNDEIYINISDFKELSYNKFKNIYKGESKTKAKELQDYLKKFIEGEDGILFELWNEIRAEISKLAYNYRVVYGQYEAQLMLNEWNSSYLEYDEFNDIIAELHYYAIYSIKEKQMESIYLQSEKLSEFVNIISKSQGKVTGDIINDFMTELNNNIEEKIDMEKFQELFG